MKRTIILLAVQALLTTLAACGGGDSAQHGSAGDLPASPVIARHP